MAVEYLKLRGFKSFGKFCEFDFSPKFTAIVGPNGSGKSNILDALKWILGEGALSGLRITKQSDLLFQGSASVVPAKDSEVILKLTDDDAGKSAILRRVYSQENGSLLYLNNKRILLQDLAAVKSEFSLGGGGFALIGQGEISQTINQKPKERRRQLDALFGIERYRERRNSSLEKLENSQNEAIRIKTLISELEARRAVIAPEVEIAVQAQGIIDELDGLRRDFYFFKRHSLEQEQANLEVQKHVLTTKLDHANFWTNLWLKSENNFEQNLASDEAFNRNKASLDEISARKNNIQRKAFQTSTNLREILRKRPALQNEIQNLQSQVSESQHELERLNLEKTQLENELASQKNILQERENISNQQKLEIQQKLSRREYVIDEISKTKISRSRLESEIKALDFAIENNNLESELVNSEYAQKSQDLENLNAEKSQLETKCAKISEELRAKTREIQELKQQISGTNSQIQKLRAESDMNFYSGIYPESVRVLLAASEKNLIHSKPIIAAETFTCKSPEIAFAVESFLGARQFWLFVNTLEEAQEGINFLKNNRAGRVTYLSLERCRPRDRDFRFRLPFNGVTGWAMDLLEKNSHWENAIAHIMGDLLIVENYETASDLVRQGAKFPIVTLEGEVFAPAGTVSGGFSRQKSGVIVARQKLERINSQITHLELQQESLEANLESNLQSEHELRNNLNASQTELENLKSQINASQRNLNAILNQLKRLQNDKLTAERQKITSNSRLEKSHEILDSLEQELESLKNIQEVQDSDFTEIKNAIKFLNERLNVNHNLLTRAQNDFANSSGKISNLEAELESGIAQERDNREFLRLLAQEKLANYKSELKIKSEIRKHEQEFLMARRKLSKLNSKLERSRRKLNACELELSQFETKISHVQSEISQLIELWDEKYPYNKKSAREVEGGRELTSSLRKLERELKSLGKYNLGALSEDQSLTERVDFLTDQLSDVENAANELRDLIQETDRQVEITFTNSMRKIDARFNALFQRLFGGGEARLQLQDGEDIWERGVEIFARPPGNKLQNLSQLSGGEQSLTAIAQIFATLEIAGTPLAVLDEVDAALDEYNLLRFSELAHEYSDSIQIIAMTHRRATMERADLIYGVTMIEPGLSQTIGINPENYK